MQDIQLWAQIIVTAVFCIITYQTFKFQKNKILDLEKSFSNLKADIDIYKQIVNVDDFKRHIEIKTETVKLETTKEVRTATINEMLQKMKETGDFVVARQETDVTRSFPEAMSFIMYIRNKEFPNRKEQQKEREDFIKSVFPFTHPWILQLLSHEDEVVAETQESRS